MVTLDVPSIFARMSTEDVISLRREGRHPDAPYSTGELRRRALAGDEEALRYLLGGYANSVPAITMRPHRFGKVQVEITEGEQTAKLVVPSYRFFRNALIFKMLGLLFFATTLITGNGILKPIAFVTYLASTSLFAFVFYSRDIAEAEKLSNSALARAYVATRDQLGGALLSILSDRAENDEPLARMLRRLNGG